MTKDIKGEIDGFFNEAASKKAAQEARELEAANEAARKKEAADSLFARVRDGTIRPALEQFAIHLANHPITGTISSNPDEKGQVVVRGPRPSITFHFQKGNKVVANLTFMHSSRHPEMIEAYSQFGGEKPSEATIRLDGTSTEVVNQNLMRLLRQLSL